MSAESAGASKPPKNHGIDSGVYSEHLAALNERRLVIATEHIYDARGVLLLAKGGRITPKVTRAIVEFKLTKPIQDSVAIDEEVGAGDLLQSFQAILNGDKTLQAIHIRYELQESLESQCRYYDQFPLLRQKITVMAERMPKTYEHSLYSAWFGVLMAKEMRLSLRDTGIVFLSALSHDIGMLHIVPEVLQKKADLSAEEWRQIQAHVVIGQKILAAIKEVPADVCTAVLEHHERCDGTGYPFAKVESELSLWGQIVAFTDAIIAIYFNRFKPEGREWRDLIPILQMNNRAFLYRNYEVMVTILRRSDLPVTALAQGEDSSSFVDQLIAKNLNLQTCLAEVNNALRSLGYSHGDRQLHALQNILIHIVTAATGSGIFEQSFLHWLEQAKEQPQLEIQRKLEETFLIQEEVHFHLQRLSRMAQIYLTNNTNAASAVVQALNVCINVAPPGM
jgi:HD-GYP domain-containing protein (c-di-GMP phosphodiesterase class II)